jgi:hypothetical protein
MTKIKNFIRKYHQMATGPIRDYVATPKPGRMLPQPNRDLKVTGWVQNILGLK